MTKFPTVVRKFKITKILRKPYTPHSYGRGRKPQRKTDVLFDKKYGTPIVPRLIPLFTFLGSGIDLRNHKSMTVTWEGK